MLVIRKEQMQIFEELERQRFIQRMTDHARDIWREEFDRLGEPAACRMVEETIERAFAHEMTTEYDAGRYVDLAFAFEDIEFAKAEWASEILGDSSMHPRKRMDLLWDKAQERLEENPEG